MQRQEVRVAFAGLLVPDIPAGIDLHITIAMRYDINEAMSREMQHNLTELIRPHLPIRVNFGNFCLLGENGSIPAYEVEIPDPVIREILQRYYARYYRPAPGKRLYPKLTNSRHTGKIGYLREFHGYPHGRGTLFYGEGYYFSHKYQGSRFAAF